MKLKRLMRPEAEIEVHGAVSYVCACFWRAWVMVKFVCSPRALVLYGSVNGRKIRLRKRPFWVWIIPRIRILYRRRE